MGESEELATDLAADATLAESACPRCGESWSASPSVVCQLISSDPVRRCAHCGIRAICGEDDSAEVTTCCLCGLPFLTGSETTRSSLCCSACVESRIPTDLPDAKMAQATESEILRAIGAAWSLVAHPGLEDYLTRLVRRVAAQIQDAPAEPRVLLLEDESVRSLSLPSGTLLLSLGLISAIEDEAEMLFVLAHDLAHAASGDAAGRLVRLGLHAVTRNPDTSAGEAWEQAALDLVRLGYGRRAEADADAKAVSTMAQLGYDPESALRFLCRLGGEVDAGNELLADYFLAHPLPRERVRLIERLLRGHVSAQAGRVNRELFRRAAGRDVLDSEMEPLDLGDAVSGEARSGRTVAWLGLLAVLVAMVAYWLLR